VLSPMLELSDGPPALSATFLSDSCSLPAFAIDVSLLTSLILFNELPG